MKTKERAVCFADKTATKNTSWKASYHRTNRLSNLKKEIGTLLFVLTVQDDLTQWQAFETTLRKYIDIKYSLRKI